jgi:hypothetical protein
MPEEVCDDGRISLRSHPDVTVCWQYGGSEMGISEAAVMMQSISESGGGLTGAS